MSTHYVAQLKIERVDKPEPPSSSSRSYPPQPDMLTEGKREISEVTMLTIKAEDLQSLLDRLGKHIALVEDD